ncbi:MAG: aldose 1-epimerase [Porphyrobacter sp.]|nr:aldose 1-epimerase [Porphyrobacter sp.]
MILVLTAGEWRAELRSETGGALASLTRGGVEVLRTMPEGAANPLDAACFPLAPYCNRIRDGRFRFAGRDVALPLNFAPERHSLHGLSWQRPWRVESQAPNKCVLVDDHDGAGPWPCAYRAEQRVRLGEQGCAITLVLTNRGETPMPAGLGLHPYVRRNPGARVRFAADHVLLSDLELIPTGVAAPADHFGDFARGAALPAETVDHCFAGWSGELTIEDELGSITITANGAPHLHLYAPADGSALACEPVSHTPDALNRAPDEMTVLPPGCSASLTMRISGHR